MDWFPNDTDLRRERVKNNLFVTFAGYFQKKNIPWSLCLGEAYLRPSSASTMDPFV